MKRIFYILICLITLSSCNSDVIVKETNDKIYVYQYNIFSDEGVIKIYSKPKVHKAVLTYKRLYGKRKRRHVKVNFNNKEVRIGRSGLRYIDTNTLTNMQLGDTVLVEETFYPYYQIELIK